MPLSRLLLLAALLFAAAHLPSSGRAAELVDCRRIWDAAPHNAFTDLLFHDGSWYCVFREGQDHVSPDGALRVLRSPDAVTWTASALLTMAGVDLRDAKISVAPNNDLVLIGAGAFPRGSPRRHQTFAWRSADGIAWSSAQAIGEPDVWLWRLTWMDGESWGIGYSTLPEDRFTRWYRGTSGLEFSVVVPRLEVPGYANEHALAVLPDRSLICLLRRDGEPGSALLGTARPPFAEWIWRDTGTRIGGPALLRLPDGRLLAVVRLYDGQVRTALMALDPGTATLKELLTLPSGGDTSYAGMVWDPAVQMLRISYYASHEGRTSIYLATVRVPNAGP